MAQAFANTLVGVNYDCGTWANRLSPAPNLAFRVALSEDWGDWATEIDTREAAVSSDDVALMHTGDDALYMTATTEQIRTCQPCAGVDTTDICVGGTWEMASGRLIAWMQAQGMPINNVRGDDRIITFLDSGAYVTAPFSVTYDTNAEEASAVSQANAASATGRWSVSDGQLNICQDAGGFSGRARITFRDGEEMTIPVASPPGGEILMAYTCAGDGLNTTMTIPGAPPMDTGYSRAVADTSRNCISGCAQWWPARTATPFLSSTVGITHPIPAILDQRMPDLPGPKQMHHRHGTADHSVGARTTG